MIVARFVKGGLAALLGISTAVALGCTSGGQQHAQNTVVGMTEMRQEIANSNDQIDKTLAAMNALPGSGDNLKTAFATFSAEVDNTQAQATSAKSKADDMNNRAAAYIQQWQSEITNITDPTLKATADARRQAMQDRFSKIQSNFAAGAEAYKTFYADLTNLRTYLSNQLTIEAVGDAKPTFDKANADGAALKNQINQADSVLSEVMGTLPTTQPANN